MTDYLVNNPTVITNLDGSNPVVHVPTVKAEFFGAKGDGTTNDSTALQAAIDSGSPVVLENGKTYLCSGLIPAATGKLIIVAKGVSNVDPPILKAATSGTGACINLSSHSGDINLTVSGIAIDDFDTAIQCDQTMTDELVANISNNKITNCARGIDLRCNVVRAEIHKNYITNMTSSTKSCWAILCGESSGGYSSTTGQFNIENNYIKTVSSTLSQASVESHGIFCYGYRVHIFNNYIEDVSSPNASGYNGGEGIYTKAAYSKIMFNKLIDANGRGEGSITIKGGVRGSGVDEGYATEVAFNTIQGVTSGKCGAGISLAIDESIYVHHNYIEGVEWYSGFTANDSCAIYTSQASEGNAIRIEHNEIYNFKGTIAIYFRINGKSHSVSHNKIHFLGVAANTAALNGIQFQCATGTVVEGLLVANNTIEFADTVVTNASVINAFQWVAIQTTCEGMKILNNTAILDDQTKETGGGAITTRAFLVGDHASQVFENCQVMGNTAIGTHDTSWFGSPATGTHVNSVEAYNSWNNAGAGTWLVQTH